MNLVTEMLVDFLRGLGFAECFPKLHPQQSAISFVLLEIAVKNSEKMLDLLFVCMKSSLSIAELE